LCAAAISISFAAPVFTYARFFASRFAVCSSHAAHNLCSVPTCGLAATARRRWLVGLFFMDMVCCAHRAFLLAFLYLRFFVT